MSSNIFICMLSKEDQDEIFEKVRKSLTEDGYSEDEIIEILSNVEDDRLWTVESIIDISKYIENYNSKNQESSLKSKLETVKPFSSKFLQYQKYKIRASKKELLEIAELTPIEKIYQFKTKKYATILYGTMEINEFGEPVFSIKRDDGTIYKYPASQIEWYKQIS